MISGHSGLLRGILTLMEMIVFAGIQGAGKTTFFNQRFSGSHIRLSLDVVGTRNREDILLFASLAAGQRIVIDNTNPTAAQRSRYAHLAKAAGFRAILYFFSIELEEAIARNARRTADHLIPEIGIRGTYAKQELPTLSEPFDDMFRVTTAKAGDWLVERIDHEV